MDTFGGADRSHVEVLMAHGRTTPLPTTAGYQPRVTLFRMVPKARAKDCRRMRPRGSPAQIAPPRAFKCPLQGAQARGAACRVARCEVPVAGRELPVAGCADARCRVSGGEVRGARCRLSAAGCRVPRREVPRVGWRGARCPLPGVSCPLPGAQMRGAACHVARCEVSGAGCRLLGVGWRLAPWQSVGGRTC